jgi:organic hydroperoxide reductase OsmC/OhrA
MKVLYVVLVLSTVALLWAAAACYMRVKRHLAAKHESVVEAEHEARRTVKQR